MAHNIINSLVYPMNYQHPPSALSMLRSTDDKPKEKTSTKRITTEINEVKITVKNVSGKKAMDIVTKLSKL